ncbi:MAG: ABC transporter permease [Chloroflexi bacterium]|nr:ABC transporter permease [Chloroflexota bacterium]
MANPRWTKLLRDLWLARGRTTMMALAIAVSLFGVGMVLSAYAILDRETTRNYMGTNPASATLELDRVDADLVRAVRQRPGIADAEARVTLLARAQVGPDEWRPLLLFVVPDFNAMRISTFRSEAGAFPPPTGAMLIERSALTMLNTRLGGEVVVKTPNGERRAVPVVGLTHDPGLAPAWQERSGYGYITPETLAWLGESGQLDELKIVVSEQPLNAMAIERTARELATWLQTQGYTVKEIQIPPPGRHPHQNMTMAIVTLLLIFSLMSLGLSAILVATMIGGLLAQQIRQIGVMKTIGARTNQVSMLYIALILAISVVAYAVAFVPSIVVGRAFATVVGDLLNFNFGSLDIPWWVFATQAAAGLLIPFLIALGPILRGSRITVYEAINDYGVRQESFGRGMDGFLGALRGLDRTLLLALRNTFRRRARLVLMLGLLAMGGAMFMTALNVAAAWERNLSDGMGARHYDLEIRLGRPEPASKLVERIGNVPGVQTVEAWGYAPASVTKLGEIAVVNTYPDGGHGSFVMRAAPPQTQLVEFPVLSGRWLEPGDSDAVVLNHMALPFFPRVAVGDRIEVSVESKRTTWRVVGIVREIGSPAAAYVPDESFARAVGQPGLARSARVVVAGRDAAARGEVIRAVERALTEGGVSVSLIISDTELRTAVGEHIVILILLLIVMAVVMAVVGVLGLTATMSTNVVERTREFGVLQTIGARPNTVLRIVASEGIFVGMLSWVLAVGLSLPFSMLVGTVIGEMSFRTPLPLVVSPLAVFLWLGIVLGGSALASALPAWSASRLTIRETLAYV